MKSDRDDETSANEQSETPDTLPEQDNQIRFHRLTLSEDGLPLLYIPPEEGSQIQSDFERINVYKISKKLAYSMREAITRADQTVLHIPNGQTKLSEFVSPCVIELKLPETLTEIADRALVVCDSLKYISIDTKKKDEFDRIVSLLPVLLRQKALPEKQMSQIRKLHNHALSTLLRTPEFSKLYLFEQKGEIIPLTRDIRAKISSYYPGDNPYYEEFKTQLEALILPKVEFESESPITAFSLLTKAIGDAVAILYPRNDFSAYKRSVDKLLSQTQTSVKKAHQAMLVATPQTNASKMSNSKQTLFTKPAQANSKKEQHHSSTEEIKKPGAKR